MKKPYVTLELNMQIFELSDVIRTSEEPIGDDNVGYWEENW